VLAVRNRLSGLSRAQQGLLLGAGGLALFAFLFLNRKKVGVVVDKAVTTASAAVESAERAILRQFAAGGQESYIDASFAVGAREGVSPYLLMGFLYTESRFGRALTKGQMGSKTVYTGDFIPRPATEALDAHMAKYPLPGAKRVYWERPQIGNLKAYKGTMWVPAYDLRLAQAGGNMQAAYTNNKGVENGVGWGFTPWQLDWKSFAPQLTAGAAWDPEKATAAAVGLIKANIRTLRAGGLTGVALVQGVIAAYNAGAGRVLDAFKAGQPLTSITADPNYLQHVSSVAQKVNKTIAL